MLLDEPDVFAQEGGNISCIPNLKLKLNLKDNMPVQKSYNSILKPLYKEVREYVQNLLEKDWVKKSTSPYSSPRSACARRTAARGYVLTSGS
jgi:hypothetical protein